METPARPWQGDTGAGVLLSNANTSPIIRTGAYVASLAEAERATLPDGRGFIGPNAEGALARTLIADGADPRARLTFIRDGKPSISGTVGAFAKMRWAGPARDPAFETWRPHPLAGTAPHSADAAPKNGAGGTGRYSPTARRRKAAGDSLSAGAGGVE